MKTWVRRSLNAGALTAGALMAAGTAAHADPALVSSDNIGILNGTQVLLPVQAPIDICGNAVGVLGTASAGCEGGSAATLNPEWGWGHYQAVSSGNVGIGNGTQIIAPIQVPVDVCGNAVGVLGSAYAGCKGGATATNGGHGHKGKGKGHGPNCGCPKYTESTVTESLMPTEGLIDGLPAVGNLLGGLTNNSAGLPIVGDLLGGLVSGAPTAAVGNVLGATPAAALLPHSESAVLESESAGPVYGGHGGGIIKPKPQPKPQPQPCGCPGGHGRGDHGHGGHGHGNGSGPILSSTGNVGILNGTQVYAPIQIPVNVSGNAVGILGTASAWSQGGATARQ